MWSYIRAGKYVTLLHRHLFRLCVCTGQQEPGDERQLDLVAQHFSEMYDCTRLAIHLGLFEGSDFVQSLRQREPRISPKHVAFRVMKKCMTEQGSAVFKQRLKSALENVLHLQIDLVL